MSPFIKFLHQIREISKLDEFPRMTHLSKLIFDQVALYEQMGNPLTVREMLSFNEIASPATIHKHLSALRSSGYVFATSDGNVTLTRKTEPFKSIKIRHDISPIEKGDMP